MLKLPSYFTIFRLFLSPLFIVMFLLHQWWVALGIAIAFEVTDVLDGFVARRFGMVSPLGKLFDPLADIMARFSVFLAFLTAPSVQADPWPVLLVAILFYSDTVVTHVRIFAASGGHVMASRLSGKVNAAFQGAGIIVFLTTRGLADSIPAVHAYLPEVYYGFLVPAACITSFSCIDYVTAEWHNVVPLAAADAE